MMSKLLTILTILLILSSCKNGNNTTTTKNADEQKADSLRIAADSLAIMRNMHAMQTGVHLHNDGDLAAVAHQDPKKTARIKKAQRESRDARIAAEKRRSAAVKRAIEKSKNE